MPVDFLGHGRIAVQSGYLGLMATVIEKRPDGSAVLVVPPGEAAGLKIGASVDVRPTGAAAEGCPGPSAPWRTDTGRSRSRRSKLRGVICLWPGRRHVHRAWTSLFAGAMPCPGQC